MEGEESQTVIDSGSSSVDKVVTKEQAETAFVFPCDIIIVGQSMFSHIAAMIMGIRGYDVCHVMSGISIIPPLSLLRSDEFKSVYGSVGLNIELPEVEEDVSSLSERIMDLLVSEKCVRTAYFRTNSCFIVLPDGQSVSEAVESLNCTREVDMTLTLNTNSHFLSSKKDVEILKAPLRVRTKGKSLFWEDSSFDNREKITDSVLKDVLTAEEAEKFAVYVNSPVSKSAVKTLKRLGSWSSLSVRKESMLLKDLNCSMDWVNKFGDIITDDGNDSNDIQNYKTGVNAVSLFLLSTWSGLSTKYRKLFSRKDFEITLDGLKNWNSKALGVMYRIFQYFDDSRSNLGIRPKDFAGWMAERYSFSIGTLKSETPSIDGRVGETTLVQTVVKKSTIPVKKLYSGIRSIELEGYCMSPLKTDMSRKSVVEKLSSELLKSSGDININVDDVLQFLDLAREELEREKSPFLVNMKDPCYVFGDVHGEFGDLRRYSRLLYRAGLASSPCNLVFLGDYIDYGDKQLECLVYVLLLKITHPERVVLLRGNHEIYASPTGDLDASCFAQQCINRFGKEDGLNIYESCHRCIDFFPVAAVVGGTAFCVHGGITECSPQSMNALRNVTGPRRVDTSVQMLDDGDRLHAEEHVNSLIHELVWNDPSHDVHNEVMFGRAADHGGTILFNAEALNNFFVEMSELDKEFENVKYLIRGHEAIINGKVVEGIRVSLGGMVTTVHGSRLHHRSSGTVGWVLVYDGKIQRFTNVFSP